ncbi:MAG: preprotein translocase subunit SecE [candidate division WOR-3 bacterium]
MVKRIVATVRNFVTDVVAEMKKVSWAKRKELIGATGLVLVISIVMALYIGLLDFIFSRLLALVLR